MCPIKRDIGKHYRPRSEAAEVKLLLLTPHQKFLPCRIETYRAQSQTSPVVSHQSSQTDTHLSHHQGYTEPTDGSAMKESKHIMHKSFATIALEPNLQTICSGPPHGLLYTKFQLSWT